MASGSRKICLKGRFFLNNMPQKTFSFISLGCFRNTYDSQAIAQRFSDSGYRFVGEGEPCDTLVVNTCGFITDAKKESLGVIEEAIGLKKKRKVKQIIVVGCLVERYRKDLEKSFPQVDEWRGVEEFNRKFKPGKNVFLPKHIGFLKVCEGCFNHCSYCAIPLIKGKFRSRPLKELIKEARFMERSGVRELNIIGQDITGWGRDLGAKQDLTLLVRGILKNTKNIPWIRMIYTHPKHFSHSLIDLIAGEPRICKYIDLPIQHINDRILKLMNRGVTKKEIKTLIETIRKRIPGCHIRTSLIVGFPSETQKEFNELVDFVEEIKFEKLGVFTYSREEGTPAFRYSGQIHQKTKEARRDAMMTIQKEISLKVNEKFIDKETTVLVDEKNKDSCIGRTQYDAYEVDGAVILPAGGFIPGKFYKVTVTDALEYDLVAG